MPADRSWPRAGAVGILALALLGSFSAEAQQGLVDAWYAALIKADRNRLGALLDPAAKIKLTDLGVEQTKAEFIASLDEWEAAVDGATIRHRIDKTEDGLTAVIVCYDFPSNDLLTQETFRIRNDLVVESEQATIAENCDSY